MSEGIPARRTDNIYLIGPRASGKSSLGRALAMRWGWSFGDMDEEIVHRVGKSIAAIVENKGWEEFRRQETVFLEQILGSFRQVVATGGGIVEKEKNREILQRAGRVFFLSGPVSVFVDRLRRDEDPEMRPSLSGRDTLEEFEGVFNRRFPLYMECADYVLDAEMGVEDLIEEIESIVEEHA